MIPYQEVDEEVNGDENGTPEGAEAAKVNGEQELDRDGKKKDEEEEGQSKEQDENIFTWSCPNRVGAGRCPIFPSAPPR